ARAFHAAGADVTLIDGLRSLEDAKRVADEVPGKKQINLIFGGKTPLVPAAELGAIGFKVVLYSTPALYLTARVLFDELGALRRAGDLAAISSRSTSFAEFQRFIESRYVRKLSDKNIEA